jgi:hypothetical protein
MPQGHPDYRLPLCQSASRVQRKTVLSVKPDTKGDTTIDGVPTSDNRKGFCRARLMEVTPEKEIVFDMWIDGSGENPALSLSSFRAEFVGESK